jgi:hypothetical protein
MCCISVSGCVNGAYVSARKKSETFLPKNQISKYSLDPEDCLHTEQEIGYPEVVQIFSAAVSGVMVCTRENWI